MPQMTPAGARVVDPVLTNVARGYENTSFVGQMLFPRVEVAQRGGTVIGFGKDSFRLYNTGRAPGSDVARVQHGHGSSTFALEQHAIEEKVPWELQGDAMEVPGIDLGAQAVRRAQTIIGRRLEKAQADLARNASAYAASNRATLSGASQWSDPASSPITAINGFKTVIRQQIGQYPNTLLLGAVVFEALQVHPAIVDRLKYTGRDVATADLMAALFGVSRVVVGDGVFLDNGGVMQDIWGKDAVLAFSAVGALADANTPSYGYSYQLRGAPLAMEPYYDNRQLSWIYPVVDEVAPVIAGADAGFLVTNAVA